MRDNERLFVEMVSDIMDWKKVDGEEKKKKKRIISDMVNNMCFNPNDVVKAIRDDGVATWNMTAIAARWIQLLDWQYKKNLYDGRNEYSVAFSQTLMQNEVVNRIVSKYGFKEINDEMFMPRAINMNPSFFSFVALSMAMDHRTLQQTFSKLVFYFLKDEYNLQFSDEYWADCPMI